MCEISFLGPGNRDCNGITLLSADRQHHRHIVRRARARRNLDVHLIQPDEPRRDPRKFEGSGSAVNGYARFVQRGVVLPRFSVSQRGRHRSEARTKNRDELARLRRTRFPAWNASYRGHQRIGVGN